MLQQTLERLQLIDTSPRIAIIGIGHELRGDDAIGSYMIRRLASSIQPSETLLLVDAGPIPENYTSLLRRFTPHLMILIDAAEMDQPPGSLQWIPWQDSIGFSASTHSLPLHIFVKYLAQELNCVFILLGVQPLDTCFDTALSPVVRDAAEKAILEMIDVFSAHPRSDTTSKQPFQHNLNRPDALERQKLCQEQKRT